MGIISGFTKKYDNKLIFDNFSFCFDKKGLCFLLGNSGVGKTTLLRTIAGLDNDYFGTVRGFGKVSMMFQEYRLFPWLSALENALVSISDVLPNDVERAKTLLEKLGFSEDDMNLKPSALSGGMKQRVSFVRAVISGADTILLDEPFKELDSALIRNMCEYIVEDSSKRLYIIVTHEDISEDVLMSAKVLDLSRVRSYESDT